MTHLLRYTQLTGSLGILQGSTEFAFIFLSRDGTEGRSPTLQAVSYETGHPNWSFTPPKPEQKPCAQLLYQLIRAPTVFNITSVSNTALGLVSHGLEVSFIWLSSYMLLCQYEYMARLIVHITARPTHTLGHLRTRIVHAVRHPDSPAG